MKKDTKLNYFLQVFRAFSYSMYICINLILTLAKSKVFMLLFWVNQETSKYSEGNKETNRPCSEFFQAQCHLYFDINVPNNNHLPLLHTRLFIMIKVPLCVLDCRGKIASTTTKKDKIFFFSSP